MLLTDDFPELGAWRTRIVASDLSQRLLARAAAGVYSEFEVRRGLPPALRDRHFDQSEGGWTLSERIRKRVEFERINLIRDWPTLPPMDLVLARNVLIYFADATRRELNAVALGPVAEAVLARWRGACAREFDVE